MANRPIFIPNFDGFPFVKEIPIEFEWYPGFAKVQAQKSILSLHQEASQSEGIAPILEISSKSTEPLGVALSAFNLSLTKEGSRLSVECAYQGSKVFKNGGPYSDLYSVSSRDAKIDERLRTSGDFIGYKFFEEEFPSKPITAFYDWLYLTALSQNTEIAEKLLEFRGFSDIAFNPKKSLNCQARSAALFVSLHHRSLIHQASDDQDFFIALITNKDMSSTTSEKRQKNTKKRQSEQLELPI